MRARALAAVAAGLIAAAPTAGCGRGSSPGDRFNGPAAMRLVRMQLAFGPRPAGSPASRRLAARLRALLPHGRFQRVPGGLRNVLGVVPGKDPRRTVVIGAHYDTKDLPGFVGAIDGGSGTAVTVQLARTLRPKEVRPTVVFALFDGEESPRGTPDNESAFLRRGIRGSKVAARSLRHAQAMALLDFVGNANLRLRRETFSDRRLWARLRTAAAEVGAGRIFPNATQPAVSDDHVPFLRAGVPAVDLIDFDFPCWHRTCDNLARVSEPSLDATGETVLRLLLDWR